MPAVFSISNEELQSITVGEEQLLTQDTFSQYQPSWSPDGLKIAYQTTQSGNPDIWVMRADGTGQTQLTFGEAWNYDAEWSPDNKKIAYVSEETGNPDIWIMDADGSNKKRLTTSLSLEQEPAFSPDGEWIAYTSDLSGDLDIWIMRSDGTEQTQVTKWPSSDTYPAWGSNNMLYFVSDSFNSKQIWNTNPFDSQQGMMQVSYSHDSDHPAPHPGLGFIAYTNTQSYPSGLTLLSLYKSKNAIKKTITSSEFTQSSPAWSPDGTKLAYITDRAGNNYDIAVIELFPTELLKTDIKIIPSTDANADIETSPQTAPPLLESLEISNDEVSIQLYILDNKISTEEDTEIILSAVSYINNEDDMTLQTILKIPSGVAVSGVYADTGGGQYIATSVIEPGNMEKISAAVIPTNSGDYVLEGELVYYFGDDKSSGDIKRIKVPLTVIDEVTPDVIAIWEDSKVKETKGACGPTIISVLSMMPLVLARRLFKN
jgi:TolB protein